MPEQYLILRVEDDPTYRKAHEMVRTRRAWMVDVQTEDGTVLFRARRVGDSPSYAWRTSAMSASAFWPLDPVLDVAE